MGPSGLACRSKNWPCRPISRNPLVGRLGRRGTAIPGRGPRLARRRWTMRKLVRLREDGPTRLRFWAWPRVPARAGGQREWIARSCLGLFVAQKKPGAAAHGCEVSRRSIQLRRIDHDVPNPFSLPRVGDVDQAVGRLDDGGVGVFAAARSSSTGPAFHVLPSSRPRRSAGVRPLGVWL